MIDVLVAYLAIGFIIALVLLVRGAWHNDSNESYNTGDVIIAATIVICLWSVVGGAVFG